jgi:serine/threonine protein kinase
MFDRVNDLHPDSLLNKKVDARRTKKSNLKLPNESPGTLANKQMAEHGKPNPEISELPDFTEQRQMEPYRTSKRLTSLTKLHMKQFASLKTGLLSSNFEKMMSSNRDESQIENSKNHLNLYKSIPVRPHPSNRSISRDRGLFFQNLLQKVDIKSDLLSPNNKGQKKLNFNERNDSEIHLIQEPSFSRDGPSIRNSMAPFKQKTRKSDGKLVTLPSETTIAKPINSTLSKLSKLVQPLKRSTKVEPDSKLAPTKSINNKIASKYKLTDELKKSNSQYKIYKPDKPKDKSNDKAKSSANLLKNFGVHDTSKHIDRVNLPTRRNEISVTVNPQIGQSDKSGFTGAIGDNIPRLLLSKKRHSHAIKVLPNNTENSHVEGFRRNYIKSQDSRRDKSNDLSDYRSIDRKAIELLNEKNSQLLAKFLATSKPQYKLEKVLHTGESSLMNKNSLSKSSIQEKKFKFLLPESEYSLANKRVAYMPTEKSGHTMDRHSKSGLGINAIKTIDQRLELGSRSDDAIKLASNGPSSQRIDFHNDSQFEPILEQSEDLSSKVQSNSHSVSQQRLQKLFSRKPKNSLQGNHPKLNMSSNLCSSMPFQLKVSSEITKPVFPLSTSNKNGQDISFSDAHMQANLPKNHSLNDLCSKAALSSDTEQLKTSSKLASQTKPYDRLRKTLLNRKEVKKLMSNIHAFFDEYERGDSDEIPIFHSSPEYYKIERQIGKGCFGSVYLATQIITNLPVALKVIQKATLKSQKAIDRIQREIDILKILSKEKFISKIFEVFEDSDQIYIVCEYQPNGDLVSFFKQSYLLSEDELRRFFYKIASSVRSLHKFSIIHRDIKMDNILLDKNFDPMLNDFGISSIFDSNLPIMDTGGTPAYLAPEVILAKGDVCFKSDVWGLGVLLYVLSFGFVPFQGDDIQSLYRCILKGKFKFPEYNFVSPELRDLLSNMIRVDIESRYSIDEVLAHRWFLGAASNQSNELTEMKSFKKSERIKKEAIVRYLNDVGFSLDFIYMSTNSNLFNHASACYENLMRNANF